MSDGRRGDEEAVRGDAEAEREANETDSIPLSTLRRRIDQQRGRRGTDGAGTGAESAPAEEAPLSTLAAEVRARDDAGGDPFENVEVGSLDGEALWDAVVDERANPADVLPASDSDVGGAAEAAAAADADETATDVDDPDESNGAADHVVDKREYCQRCEYFSAPPEVACTNAGTDIVELADGDRFRVRNCPKVAAGDEPFSTRLDEE